MRYIVLGLPSMSNVSKHRSSVARHCSPIYHAAASASASRLRLRLTGFSANLITVGCKVYMTFTVNCRIKANHIVNKELAYFLIISILVANNKNGSRVDSKQCGTVINHNETDN